MKYMHYVVNIHTEQGQVQAQAEPLNKLSSSRAEIELAHETIKPS